MNSRAASDAKTRPAALETLRLKDFRYLWMSNGATFTGQQLANMGMAWLVLELTDSVLWVGVNNGIPAVPIVLFSLLGGVLADRLDRRQLMIQQGWDWRASLS